jgi:hypothetical protein
VSRAWARADLVARLTLLRERSRGMSDDAWWRAWRGTLAGYYELVGRPQPCGKSVLKLVLGTIGTWDPTAPERTEP